MKGTGNHCGGGPAVCLLEKAKQTPENLPHSTRLFFTAEPEPAATDEILRAGFSGMMKLIYQHAEHFNKFIDRMAPYGLNREN